MLFIIGIYLSFATANVRPGPFCRELLTGALVNLPELAEPSRDTLRHRLWRLDQLPDAKRFDFLVESTLASFESDPDHDRWWQVGDLLLAAERQGRSDVALRLARFFVDRAERSPFEEFMIFALHDTFGTRQAWTPSFAVLAEALTYRLRAHRLAWAHYVLQRRGVKVSEVTQDQIASWFDARDPEWKTGPALKELMGELVHAGLTSTATDVDDLSEDQELHALELAQARAYYEMKILAGLPDLYRGVEDAHLRWLTSGALRHRELKKRSLARTFDVSAGQDTLALATAVRRHPRVNPEIDFAYSLQKLLTTLAQNMAFTHPDRAAVLLDQLEPSPAVAALFKDSLSPARGRAARASADYVAESYRGLDPGPNGQNHFCGWASSPTARAARPEQTHYFMNETLKEIGTLVRAGLAPEGLAKLAALDDEDLEVASAHTQWFEDQPFRALGGEEGMGRHFQSFNPREFKVNALLTIAEQLPDAHLDQEALSLARSLKKRVAPERIATLLRVAKWLVNHGEAQASLPWQNQAALLLQSPEMDGGDELRMLEDFLDFDLSSATLRTDPNGFSAIRRQLDTRASELLSGRSDADRAAAAVRAAVSLGADDPLTARLLEGARRAMDGAQHYEWVPIARTLIESDLGAQKYALLALAQVPHTQQGMSTWRDLLVTLAERAENDPLRTRAREILSEYLRRNWSGGNHHDVHSAATEWQRWLNPSE